MVIVTGLLLGSLFVLIADRAVQAGREPVRTGYEELIGRDAEVRSPLEPERPGLRRGRALARPPAATAKAGLAAGDRVRVEAVDGLTLRRAAGRAPPENEKGAS